MNVETIKVYMYLVNVDVLVIYQGYDYGIKGAGITDHANSMSIVLRVRCGLCD